MITFFYILKFICLFSTILITFSNPNPVYSVLNLVLFFVTGSIILILLGVDFLPYVFIIVYAGAVAVLFLFVVIILKIKLGSTRTNYKNVFIIFLFSIVLSIFHYSLKFIDFSRYVGTEFEYSSTPYGFCDDKFLAYFPFLWGSRIIDPIEEGPSQKKVLLNFDPEGKSPYYLEFAENALICSRQISTNIYLYFPYKESRMGRIINENYFMYDSQSSLTNLGKILFTEYNIHFVISGIILLVAIIGAISLTRRPSTSLKQKIYIQTHRSNIVGKFDF
jgi:NADH:ubiquinone oxidoreductase subunit 6 (subunit J)